MFNGQLKTATGSGINSCVEGPFVASAVSTSDCCLFDTFISVLINLSELFYGNLNSSSNFLVNYADISLLSTKQFRTVFKMRLYLIHPADFECMHLSCLLYTKYFLCLSTSPLYCAVTLLFSCVQFLANGNESL